MQLAQHHPSRVIMSAVFAPPPCGDEPATCPAAMARYLRRTSGDAAYCFARTMHEDVAWANEEWGAYWADVMRLV